MSASSFAGQTDDTEEQRIPGGEEGDDRGRKKGLRLFAVFGIASRKKGKVSHESRLELSSAAKANDYTNEYGVGREEICKEERLDFSALAFFCCFSTYESEIVLKSQLIGTR